MKEWASLFKSRNYGCTFNPTTWTIRIGLGWINIFGGVGFIFLNPNWIGLVSGSCAKPSG